MSALTLTSRHSVAKFVSLYIQIGDIVDIKGKN
jgi:hypothetical protein